MAIDKKLIHFQTWNKFISDGVGSEENITTPTSGTEDARNAIYGQIKGTSIVFIKDVGKIWTHGKVYDGSTINVDELQDKLVSGENIKTINGTSILGEGGVSVGSITSVDTGDILDDVDVRYATEQYVDDAIANVDVDTDNLATKEELETLSEGLGEKQEKLVSGTNIKTINGESILGEGNLTVEGDGGFVLPLSMFGETPTISQEDYDKLLNTINNAGVIKVPIEIISNRDMWSSVFYSMHYSGIILVIRIEDLNTYIDTPIIILDDLTVTFSEEYVYPKASKLSQLENDSNFVSSDGLKTINGESIIGSGNIIIGDGSSSGGSGAYSEVKHGTSDTTFTLTPNTFHVWDEVASLTLDFGSEISGVANEFLFQFTSGSTATSLSLPSVVEWVGGIPTIESNKVYQCSIINNIGLIVGVWVQLEEE